MCTADYKALSSNWNFEGGGHYFQCCCQHMKLYWLPDLFLMNMLLPDTVNPFF